MKLQKKTTKSSKIAYIFDRLHNFVFNFIFSQIYTFLWSARIIFS